MGKLNVGMIVFIVAQYNNATVKYDRLKWCLFFLLSLIGF